MNFAIPVRFGDLQNKQAPTDYSVNEVFSARVLPNKLADLRTALRTFENGTVINHFDVLYSVLCHKNSWENNLFETAWTCLTKSLSCMHLKLRTALEGSSVKDANLRNSLAMCLYLANEFIELFENEANKPTTDQIIAGKKKKGKSKAKASDGLSLNWERERAEAVRTLTQLMGLPVQRLWDPPMVEQNIINCLGNCCFKLLQNPSTAKDKETKEEVFGLLATLVKRHKYSLTTAIQAMENLKLFEHMATVMAEAMAVIAREFSFPKTAQDLLREISSLSPDYLQRDSNAAKSYSIFLVELADRIPDVILPVISVLLPFLDNDPHSMRNAMLVVLGKLIMNLLTGNDLDENKKNMREEFLDILCEHLHDINSFVRSKVLQVFVNIVEARTLPLSRHIQVSRLVHGRLLDKLPLVRKNAMQCLIALITHNPYGASLSDKELVSALESEKAKLMELRTKSGLAPLPESAVISPVENWNAMLPETGKAVEDYLLDNPDLQEMIQDQSKSGDDSITVDRVKEEIIALLTSCKPTDAVQLLVDSQVNFHGTDLDLGIGEDESCSLENMEAKVLDKLKSIFLAQTVVEIPESVDDGTEEGAQLKEELSRQEIVVKYLQETYKFCNLLQDAMPTICKLLSSKTTTDVVESIQLVITIVQFGLTDAMHGLAAMLKLVWVPANNIKSAVVQAFRLLYLYSDDTGESREPAKVVECLIALTKTFGAVFGQLTAWEELVAEFVRSGDISSQVLQMLWQVCLMKVPNTTIIDSKISLRIIAMAAQANPAIVGSNLDTLESVIVQEGITSDLLIARDVCMALLSLTNKTPHLSKDHPFVTGFVKLMADTITDTSHATWIPMMEQAIKFIYNLSETPDVTCGDLAKQVYSRAISTEASPPLNISVLTRFVHLVGQVTLCQITYLEGDVQQDLKRKRQKNKDQTANTTGGDELGQTSTDDIEMEVILKVIEHELLNQGNLLANFLPLLVNILSNRSKFDDDALQAAATLSLGKFMLLSPSVCRDNLRLYFTVLERSRCTEVKTNAIVALSDMVFRYPNELEPWTANLYARLRDECPRVRKATLMVMTRLILNDMVKVKGQISGIAVCLVDEEEAIRRMAGQFFTELSTKGSALYNVLLDIVSRLSDAAIGVDEDKFRVICTELFNHVTSDKHCESLMEKFLLRLGTTSEERQWRDIAFCLSRLTYTEKSIKKLMEKFSCIADKLVEQEVYNSFMVIVERATSKLKLKPGAKELLAELSAKVEVAHNRGAGDADALENTSEMFSTKKSVKASARKRKRTRRTKSTANDSDDSFSDASTCSQMSTSSVSVTQRQTGTRRSTRKVTAMRPLDNLLGQLDEDSEENTEENFIAAPKSTKSHKDKKKLLFSSSEDEEVTVQAVLSPAPSGRSTRNRKT